MFYRTIILFYHISWILSPLQRNEPVAYYASISKFMNVDQLRSNSSPFTFCNSDPINWKDINGDLPIRIAKNLGTYDALDVFTSVQKLTNDKLKLRYNTESGFREIQLNKTATPEEICFPNGTRLIRSILGNPTNHVTIDVNHSTPMAPVHPNQLHTTYVYGEPNISNETITFLQQQKTVSKLSFVRYNTVANVSSSTFHGNLLMMDWKTGKTFTMSLEQASTQEISIAHELVHANQFMNSYMWLESTNSGFYPVYDLRPVHIRRPMPSSNVVDLETPLSELMAVGLTTETPRSYREGINFDLPFSENNIRLERGLPLRLNYHHFFE